MPIEGLHRGSDSPYVARVWRGRASGVGTMNSIATSTWELVFWQDDGIGHAEIRGPETSATGAPFNGDSESFGITFAHGTAIAHLPISGLVDGAVESPHVTATRFVLAGDEWEIPCIDSAEQFVHRLAGAGVLVRDPLVAEVVDGAEVDVGSRTVQRRVAAATGLTHGAIRRIERARAAAVLLGDGVAATDVVHALGYYDQPHLARSLRRFIGRTATQLQRRTDVDDPMSLLYKTEPAGRS